MIVLLTGDSAGIHAEALRNYYSYRGNACISYDFEQPVQNVHYAAMMALRPYEEYSDKLFHWLEDSQKSLSSLRTWLESEVPLHVIANSHIKKLTARWEELKMFYIVIVYGEMTKDDMEAFPQSLKVRIDDVKGPGATDRSVVSSDCAGCDIFDLVVDTSVLSPNEAASTIGDALHSKAMSAFDNSSRREPSSNASV